MYIICQKNISRNTTIAFPWPDYELCKVNTRKLKEIDVDALQEHLAKMVDESQEIHELDELVSYYNEKLAAKMRKQNTKPEKDDVGYWLISNEVCTNRQTKEEFHV